jgi:MFS transporter, DHA2 family, methylenomycin A resistance protein
MRWGVVAACASVFALLMLDTTLVNIALPSIAGALEAEISDLQWVVSGFALVMASTLPLGGAFGDRYGQRTVVLVGVALFVISSIGAAASPSVGWLIAVRIPQAAGTALMLPNALALVSLSVPAQERGRAIGAYTGLAGTSLLFGPVLGGWLLDTVGWPAIFLVNVPIGTLAFVGIWKVAPRPRPTAGRRLDLAGALTAAVTLLALTGGLVEAGRRGWDAAGVWTLLALAVAGAVAFVQVERRVASPMIDVDLLRGGTVMGALAIALVNYVGLNTVFFLLPIHLQAVQGLSGTATGLVLIAFTVGVATSAPVWGHIADRAGVRVPLVLGSLCMAACTLVLSGMGPGSAVTAGVLLALVVGGLGTGALNAGEATAVLVSVPPDRTAVASAALSVTRQSGGIFGVALFGSVVELVSRARVQAETAALGVSEQVRDALAAGVRPTRVLQLPPDLPADLVGPVEDVVRASLAAGISTVMRVVAVLMVVAAVLGATVVRPRSSTLTSDSPHE